MKYSVSLYFDEFGQLHTREERYCFFAPNSSDYLIFDNNLKNKNYSLDYIEFKLKANINFLTKFLEEL